MRFRLWRFQRLQSAAAAQILAGHIVVLDPLGQLRRQRGLQLEAVRRSCGRGTGNGSGTRTRARTRRPASVRPMSILRQRSVHRRIANTTRRRRRR